MGERKRRREKEDADLCVELEGFGHISISTEACERLRASGVGCRV